MRSNLIVGFGLACFVSAGHGQNYKPRLTEFGIPDIQGVWNFSTYAPFERPERLGEQEFFSREELQAAAQRRAASAEDREQRETEAARRALESTSTSVASVNFFWMEMDGLTENKRTSVIIHPSNGRIPPVRDGVIIQRSDPNGVRELPGERPVKFTHGGISSNGPEDRGLSERCLVFNSGPPLFSGPYNNNLQIIQNRDHVVLLTEMGFDARIVPLQQKFQLDNEITLWSGDSSGYFNGNTLVVETRNFTAKVGSLSLRGAAYGNAEARLLIEKFIPTSATTMDYEWTIEDSITFTDRIVGIMPMTRTDDKLYEYACHAGNYAIGNILKGARAVEAGF
ncbi:MAG: hypothetical protein OXU30_09855 [Gammaproteobacteria bacterium]|nr:hypothetical protein [Gammaproteobacteria bacterium]